MHATTRRGFAALIAAALSAAAFGSASAQVVIQERVMPAPIVETIPAAPGADYHWVPGHWVWRPRLGQWVWNRGHYVVGVVPAMPAAVVETVPASPGAGWYWVRGHYAWEGGRWAWHRGIWVR
jgi:WXXGXW repeat (2 copies)